MTALNVILSIGVFILCCVAVWYTMRPHHNSQYHKFKAIDEKKGKE